MNFILFFYLCDKIFILFENYCLFIKKVVISFNVLQDCKENFEINKCMNIENIILIITYIYIYRILGVLFLKV